ncbi:M23 family metallopeptidase [Microbacterium sp. MYb62]|uniref:M23 family metallopeptidase n=1 Tax=Microbacterium sp. MYb62 TaxID=1848690 RepID=UPI000CFCC3AB|nr:M23 family metallopeptidase [Microbacterium sp. MYb62]PRB18982.1 metalloendopeptidase [Microbacterium sp. MYb62]
MRRALVAAYRLRGPVYGIAALALIVSALSSGIPLGDGSRQARGVISLVALGALAVSILLVFVGPRLLPTRDTAVIGSPVSGRWLGMNSPATKVPSHGIRMYGQAYAIDLVHEPTDGDRPAFGDGPALRRPQDFPAFGEAVFAMIDGTVVRATDWRRDHRARASTLALIYMLFEGAVRELGGPGFILGNHVTIRGANGEYATVAHLQRHSIAVRVGDTVRTGEQIARCGNSGNSSEPHVHAQLMDRVSPWTAQGLPMAFTAVSLDDGPEHVAALPETGQHMTTMGLPHPAAGPSPSVS